MGGRGSGRRPQSKNIEKRLISASRIGDSVLAKEIALMFDEIDPDDPQKRQRLRVALRSMYKVGTYGHGKGCPPVVRALQELFDRMEGKPAQSVSMDITQRTPEEHVESILRALEALRPEKSDDDEHRPTRVN